MHQAQKGNVVVGQIENVVQCVCDLKDRMPGEEWTLYEGIFAHLSMSSSHLIEPG